MMKDSPERETHPSYGKIQISRCTGSPGVLFASSVKHGEFIAIRISEASLKRDLHSDWITDEGRIIEVLMSPVQFAELLTTHGTGVPCTISWTKGVGDVPRPPFTDRAEQFHNEFQQGVRKVGKILDEVQSVIEEAMSGKTITKSKMQEVQGLVEKAHTQIVCNLPFVLDSFGEQMQNIVTMAKGEIDAHQLHKALLMAQDQLRLVEDRREVDNAIEDSVVELD